jgi:hypothetical protein
MATPTRAVLRVADQQRERSPTVCVKTGERTDRAARVRASSLPRAELWEATVGTSIASLVGAVLRRPTASVVLAVSEPAWRRWRRRLGRVLLLAMLGVGAIVVGASREQRGLVLLGAVLLASSWWRRRRAWQVCWVGLQLRPDHGDIIVSRTHPAFAAEARRIYEQSIRGG